MWNEDIILFCHKIQWIISSERNESIYAWATWDLLNIWLNEELHDDDDVAKNKSTYHMKFIFMLVGALIWEVAVL